MSAARALALYTRALEAHPVRTQMMSSAALWCSGDLIAQALEHRRLPFSRGQAGTLVESLERQQQPLDVRRTIVQTTYAALVWAPVAHFWYESLDRVARKVAQVGSRRFLLSKLALELAILHPVSLVAFFGCVGIANGEAPSRIIGQLRHDFAPTLGMEWILWTPLDVANFKMIPVRHQLLVVNCGCLAESVGLSLIKENGISVPHRRAEEIQQGHDT